MARPGCVSDERPPPTPTETRQSKRWRARCHSPFLCSPDNLDRAEDAARNVSARGQVQQHEHAHVRVRLTGLRPPLFPGARLLALGPIRCLATCRYVSLSRFDGERDQWPSPLGVWQTYGLTRAWRRRARDLKTAQRHPKTSHRRNSRNLLSSSHPCSGGDADHERHWGARPRGRQVVERLPRRRGPRPRRRRPAGLEPNEDARGGCSCRRRSSSSG